MDDKKFYTRNGLQLCKEHRQEDWRCEFDPSNCAYCELEKEGQALKKAIEALEINVKYLKNLSDAVEQKNTPGRIYSFVLFNGSISDHILKTEQALEEIKK